MKDEKMQKPEAGSPQENNVKPPSKIEEKRILLEEPKNGGPVSEKTQSAPSQAAQKILERLKKTAVMRQVSEPDTFLQNQTASYPKVSPSDRKSEATLNSTGKRLAAEKREEDKRIAMDYTKILEIQKEVNRLEPRHIKTQALTKPSREKYPILLGSILFVLLGLVAMVSALDSEVERVRRTPLKENPVSKPAELAPQSTILENRASHGLPPKEETLEEKMRARDLVAWGDFWIPTKQKESLREICSVGNRPDIWPLKPTSLKMRYDVKKQAPIFRLEGIFNLPKGLSLSFSLQWLSHDKKIVYGKQNGQTDALGGFENTFSLESPLSLEGLYCFRFSLSPEEQPPFVRYFLRLESKKTWEIPFMLGDPKALEKQYEQMQEQYEAALRQLDKQAQTLSLFLGEKKKLVASEWEKKNTQWIQEFALLQTKIRSIDPAFVAVYRESEEKILASCQKYYELLSLCQNWQNSFDGEPPPFLLLETHFKILYEESLLALTKEKEALMKILEDKTLLQASPF